MRSQIIHPVSPLCLIITFEELTTHHMKRAELDAFSSGRSCELDIFCSLQVYLPFMLHWSTSDLENAMIGNFIRNIIKKKEESFPEMDLERHLAVNGERENLFFSSMKSREGSQNGCRCCWRLIYPRTQMQM